MKYIIAAVAAMLLLTSGAMALVGAGGFEVGATSGGTPNPDYPMPAAQLPSSFYGQQHSPD
jgi:hypothetical protein